LSKENSSLFTNEKISSLTNNTTRQWSTSCGPQPNCGAFSTLMGRVVCKN